MQTFIIDFGKYNGQKSRNNEPVSYSGNTRFAFFNKQVLSSNSIKIHFMIDRVVTETVSESDGHTTHMETTVHHSRDESDPLRESMQQILDQFMTDSNSKLNTS